MYFYITKNTTFDGQVLVPAFFEGGRYTFDNIHWVADGDELIPAGENEFAKDPAFGYKASDLRMWVKEKTGERAPLSRSLGGFELPDV